MSDSPKIIIIDDTDESSNKSSSTSSSLTVVGSLKSEQASDEPEIDVDLNIDNSDETHANQVQTPQLEIKSPEARDNNPQHPILEEGVHPNSQGDNVSFADDDNVDAQEFVVERVIDKYVDPRTGRVKYNVKWESYHTRDSTWEPVENLAGCDFTVQTYQLNRANVLANRHQEMMEAAANISVASIEPLPSTSRAQAAPSTPDQRPKRIRNTPLSTANDNTANKPQRPKLNLRGVSARPMREWKVEDILGITEINEEKYFLLKLENYNKQPFIRATVANRLFPDKVIDFYFKHLNWRRREN